MTGTTSRARQELSLGAIAGLVVGWLVMIGLVIYFLGGFETRSRLTKAETDQVLEMGPVAISLHSATATKVMDDWWVAVEGTCQLRTESSVMISAILRDAFVAFDKASQTSNVRSTLIDFGARSDVGQGRADLSPGLDPMPCTLNFTMEQGYRPDSNIVVQVSQLDFGDISIVESGHESWYATRVGWVVQVPLSEVAD